MCQKKNNPAYLELVAGKNYAWCTCGLSRRLPFCDGKHGDSGMLPLIFSVAETKSYKICNCQLSGNQPFCDNSHSNQYKPDE